MSKSQRSQPIPDESNNEVVNAKGQEVQPSSTNFVKLDEYSEYHKDVVYGYIRKIQSLLPSDKPYFNIPDLVKHNCLMYCIGEYFAYSNYIKAFKLENNDQQVTLCKNPSNPIYSIYGQIESNKDSNTIYIWTFKIMLKKKYQFPTIFIGITESDNRWYNKQFNHQYNRKPWYCYSSDGHKCWYALAPGAKYGVTYGHGDIVKMELNSIENKLEFYVNGKSQGNAFRGIELNVRQFSLAITLSKSSETVQLLSFQQIKKKNFKKT